MPKFDLDIRPIENSTRLLTKKMTSLRLVISIVGIVLLFTSCDPAKLIILKNRTDEPVYFRWTVEADSIVQIHLGTKKNDRESSIYFGFGSWPKNEIERFVTEDVQSIEIETSENKIVMTDKSEMKQFLIERRHGLLNNFITIRIGETLIEWSSPRFLYQIIVFSKFLPIFIQVF